MKKILLILLLTCMGSVSAADLVAADQAISLDTRTGKINGSLLLPATLGQPMVALIIAGSGPTDRDGNSPIIKGNNDSLKGIATALASAGIASVRFDKRGVAASAAATASESDLRFDTYVRDAAEWIKLLKADSRFSAVAVIGHSEGSLIGMIAARESGADAFVSVSGPARGAATVLRQQLAGKLSDALAKRNVAILTALEQGQTVADVPSELNSLYRASVQPYLISWFRYVPEVEIAKLTIPTLIVQGDTDIQVDSKEAEALKRARPEAQLLIVKGMNHVLKLVPPDRTLQIASYGDPSLPVADELSKTLVLFLSKLSSNAAVGKK